MHGQSAHPCSARGSHAGFPIVEMSSSQPPLVVDLDGTLVRTDMLHESAIRVVRERPLDLLRLPVWLWRGKAAVKQALAERASFDPATLPYHEAFLAWLRTTWPSGAWRWAKITRPAVLAAWFVRS